MTTATEAKKLTTATCSGCGAEIYWIKTTEGKAMPVDTPKRRIMIPSSWNQGPDGKITDATWISVSGYQSHFASCPKAGEFRK